MKKLASLIGAVLFSAAIALTIINSAAQTHIGNKVQSYATICPIPPPSNITNMKK